MYMKSEFQTKLSAASEQARVSKEKCKKLNQHPDQGAKSTTSKQCMRGVLSLLESQD